MMNSTGDKASPEFRANSSARQFAYVKVKDLKFMERGGNRTVINKRKVREIAETLDLNAFGVVDVGPNDGRGRYPIIDGQHRVLAVRLLGWAEQVVPCYIYTELSEYRDQARVLYLKQVKTAWRPCELFLKRVAGQYPDAVEIMAVVRRAGLVVRDAPGDGVVKAVRALEAVHQQIGAEGLAAVLDLAVSTWGKTEAAVSAPILRGFGLVLHRYDGKVDQRNLADKLRGYPSGPEGLLGAARGQMTSRGSTVPQTVAGIMVARYNIGKRSAGRLPDWWSQG